jgi:hypothetical protein
MSIKPAYFRLLDHLGSTATIRELHERADAADMVGLRHDVDHDLDLALEMAHHEHARGARSTYYLLHTHAYFSSDRLVDACRQFVAYGHEVALHVNLISEWMAGAIDDLDVRIEEVLAPLRAAGIDVTGVSAHGDRMCYEHKFINYWMWRELKPADPRMSEHGLSAEGIPVSDERFRIPYPQDHQLHRADGAALPLWRCSMEDHGLRYDAAHVPVDHYWTDTGGSFTRSGDPMEHDCKAGRHQVLIHPFWWRGEKKVVFVLSTARSGSKWFANFVDRATSCRGLHEWTLNHRLAGAGSVEEKRTNTDFAGLVEDRSHAERLIEQALAHHHRLPVDVVEANVYLEAFADLLEGRERVQLVHLHRDAREVVRSILGRGWYATPYDRRHRAVDVERWDELDQFERACWYVRSVHEAIPAGAARLSFERMTQDRDYLVGWLEEMGLIVHPLLVEAAYEARLNRTERHRCPPYGQWPAEHQRVFDEICGAAQAELGYEAPGTSPGAGARGRSDSCASRHWTVHLAADLTQGREFPLSGRRVTWALDQRGLQVRTDAEDASSAHLMLAGATWGAAPAEAGFPAREDHTYLCRIAARAPAEFACRVFVLWYDGAGEKVDQEHAATIRSDTEVMTAAFNAPAGATHGALALHLGGQRPDRTLLVTDVYLKSRPLADYRVPFLESPPARP